MRAAFAGNTRNHSDPFARCPDCGGTGRFALTASTDVDCGRCEGEQRVLSSTLTEDERLNLESGQEQEVCS